MKDRIQKVLAHNGYGSRRQIEAWIEEGRIKVDGKVAKLGCQIDGSERIEIDGREVAINTDQIDRRVLLYYKPEGEITTRHDPEGRPTVFSSLPKIHNGRWITVGRLDINTQGLLLVTNDGELAHRLMHPSHEVEREYAVRVIGDFTDEMADNMRNGVMFEDGLSKFEEITWSGGTGANFWYHVTVKGGKNREVRRLWESQGLMVSRLIRIRYGNVELPRSLRAGQFIDIEEDVLKELVESVGLEHQKESYSAEKERIGSKGRSLSRGARSKNRASVRAESTQKRGNYRGKRGEREVEWNTTHPDRAAKKGGERRGKATNSTPNRNRRQKRDS